MVKPAYRINRPFHLLHWNRYKRRRRLALSALLILALAVGFVLVDLHHLNMARVKPQIGQTDNQQIAGPKQFKSAFFEFYDTSPWQYAPNDSTPSKLTYLLYSAGVPVHSVSVYVNQTPTQDDLATTRVLPVQIQNGDALTTAGKVSEACGTHYAPTDPKNIKPMALAGTNLLCVPDSPQYTVVLGQVGGDYNLTLKRASGQTANYIILYHNLSVDPDPSAFERIVKTFQAL